MKQANSVTKEQVGAFLQIIKALADAIKQSGPLGIGAGVLYASVMSVMSMDAFERSIGYLTGAGLVKRDGQHCLTWIGPVQRHD